MGSLADFTVFYYWSQGKDRNGFISNVHEKSYFYRQMFGIAYHQSRWNYNDEDDVKK